MDLAGFHSLVRTAINRGTRYDSEIVTMTRQAARWLERNKTLKYMEVLESFGLVIGDTEFELNGFNKSIHFVRLAVTDDRADWHFLKKGDPKDFQLFRTDRPQYYWEEAGTKRFVLNSKSDAAYEGEIFYSRYTEWPTDTTKEHWLIDNAEDLLLAQTILHLVPILRSTQLLQLYKPLRDEALRTVLLSEEEREVRDGSHSMKFFTG